MNEEERLRRQRQQRRDYNKTEKGRTRTQKYHETKEYRESKDRYNKSEKGKKTREKFREKNKDFLRAYRKVYQSAYKHNLHRPSFGVEAWKNSLIPRRVARNSKGRFISWIILS